MDSQKIVLRETCIVAVGELILSAIMVGIFAALGYFQMNVLWGAVVGCVVMTGNYFFLAITVSQAMDRAKKGEVKKAQTMIQLSSVVRLLVMCGAVILAIKLGTNVPATVIPLVFARPILMLAEFFRKKGD